MKVALMGAGRISKKMALTLNELKHPEIELYAIASRSQEKAQSFAQEFNIPKVFGSYLEMLEDPNVDLVYIATPHSEHYQNALDCIAHKKHMLIEKAFTLNAKQAQEIITKAQEAKLLITEAIWTRYMPSRKIIDEVLNSGAIGKVQAVQANLSYPVTYKERIVKPELAGGALLDLGIYPLNFALMVLKSEILDFTGNCVKSELGIDLIDNIALTFTNKTGASLHASVITPSDRMGYIYGENGYLAVTNINNPEKIERFDKDHKLIESYPLPKQVTGYEYQVIECLESIKQGKTSCPSISHQETIEIMQIMDKLRKTWGIIYPQEKED